MNAEQLAKHLGVTVNESGWTSARCPAHNDESPSFSFLQTVDGRYLNVKCHAGCSIEEIVHRLNIGADVIATRNGWELGPVLYTYLDEKGDFLFQVVRRIKKGRKDFTQRHYGDSGWVWKKGKRQVPYHLDLIHGKIQPTDVLIVAEGEKDVDRLLAEGAPYATTNAMGAGKGKWTTEHTSALVAAGVNKVVILFDNDREGIDHAKRVKASLVKAGILTIIVPLPGIEQLKKKGADVSDWLDAGHFFGELADAVAAAEQAESTNKTKVTDNVTADNVEIEDEDEETAEDAKAHKKARDFLVDLVLATSPDLFHSGADETGYISVKRNGRVLETFPVLERSMAGWMGDLQWDATKTLPDPRDVKAAQGHLNYLATRKGDEKPVWIRTAPHPTNGIVIDLGTPDWSQVHVTRDGWTVVTEPNPEVKFVRPKGIGPMVLPRRSDDQHIAYEKVMALMNVEEHDQRLLASWITYALRPCIQPYPILILQGEQGSGKSSTERKIIALADPSQTDLQAPPKSVRDCIIAASHCHVMAYDNLSVIGDVMSDCFCRIATGSGFRARALYTDADEAIFKIRRPIILNGIAVEELGRPDLLDRALIITAPIIERYRDEEEIEQEFRDAAPEAFAYLLDLMAETLKHHETAKTDPDLRMADFGKWLVAMESAWKLIPGTLVEAYREKRDALSEVALDSSIAQAIRILVEHQKPVKIQGKVTMTYDVKVGAKLTSDLWVGTPNSLLLEIGNVLALMRQERAMQERDYPRNARAMSSALARLKPSMRRNWGYQIAMPSRPSRHNGVMGRWLQIKATSQERPDV